MAAQDIVENSAPTKPTKHLVHVNWFERDPGGATIFVMPPRKDVATQQLIGEDDTTSITH